MTLQNRDSLRRDYLTDKIRGTERFWHPLLEVGICQDRGTVVSPANRDGVEILPRGAGGAPSTHRSTGSVRDGVLDFEECAIPMNLINPRGIRLLMELELSKREILKG